MKIVDGIVYLNRGHCVPKKGVTPAEAALLTALHCDSVGGAVFMFDPNDVKETERTTRQELDRLRGKYQMKYIKLLYPSNSAQLPETFEDAKKDGFDQAIGPDEKAFMSSTGGDIEKILKSTDRPEATPSRALGDE